MSPSVSICSLLLVDLLLLGDGLLAELDALNRHYFLLDHGPLLGQDDLVLLFADVGTVERLVAVRVGDRLPLHPHLLTTDRHGDVLLLGDDVLAQPGLASLNLFGADLELLLRAGHRLVGGRARGVVAGGVVMRVVGCAGAAAVRGQAGVRVLLGVVHAVVAVEGGFLVLACQCDRCSFSSAARRAARVWSSPLRRNAECGPSGRHHRRRTPLVNWFSNACLSVAFPASRMRATSTCSTPMYGCSRRSASRSAVVSSSFER